MIKEKEKKISAGGLEKEQMDRFSAHLKEAKQLEKRINSLIREFERKYDLNCWVTTASSREVCIDIYMDRDLLMNSV